MRSSLVFSMIVLSVTVLPIAVSFYNITQDNFVDESKFRKISRSPDSQQTAAWVQPEKNHFVHTPIRVKFPAPRCQGFRNAYPAATFDWLTSGAAGTGGASRQGAQSCPVLSSPGSPVKRHQASMRVQSFSSKVFRTPLSGYGRYEISFH